MRGRTRKHQQKLAAVLSAWLVVVQAISPGLVLAEELPGEMIEEHEPAGARQELVTGDAVAEAISETEIATTAVESEVETSVVNVGGETDVTPFALQEPGEASGGVEAAEELVSEEASAAAEITGARERGIEVENQTQVEVETVAIADTGHNQQEAEGEGEQIMETGDAAAVANSVTLVNTTLVNSQLQVGVINVLSAWDGDVILDPLEEGGELVWGAGIAGLTINNEGTVEIITEASATTGGNSQAGGEEQSLTTGAAMALASSYTQSGLTMTNAQLLQILGENLWMWTGKIYNWEYPGSVSDPSDLWGQTGQEQGCTDCATRIGVNNQTEVTVVTRAEASTGGNSQVGATTQTMQTGNALAAATSTTLVNTTLINSKLTLLHLMLFDEWSGNLVFAYPDLEVKATAPEQVQEGEEISYTVTVTNLGQKKAVGVSWDYLVTNDEHEVDKGGAEKGELLPGESLSATVGIGTEGRGGHTVKLVAQASGTNTESSASNNWVEVTTLVVAREATQEEEDQEPGEPEETTLALSGQNNAGEGVYLGDGVRYEFIAENLGPVRAMEIMLTQAFYTPEGELISEVKGLVGELALNERARIDFVMTPKPPLTAGSYYTISYLTGKSDQGVELVSNGVINQIPILARLTGQLVGQVQAAEGPRSDANADVAGEVLGADNSCQDCQAWPWYWGVGLGSLAYFWVSRKRKGFGQIVRWGLTIPLTGYAGVLWQHPDCRQGLVLLASLGIWCRWYLPIAYGLYGLTGLVSRLLYRRGGN